MLGDERGVLDEWGEVAVDEAEELHVDQQLVHRGVAHALADAERAAVHAVGERRGRERVDRPEAAVVVPVVVDLHRAVTHDLVAHERQQIAHPFRRRMADRVRDADALRAQPDGGVVEADERLRVGPRRVLGDEHHRQTGVRQRRDRRLDALQHRVERPVFREAADRRAADERACLDRDAGLGRGLDRATHVVRVRADRAVRLQVPEACRLLRERDDALTGLR